MTKTSSALLLGCALCVACDDVNTPMTAPDGGPALDADVDGGASGLADAEVDGGEALFPCGDAADGGVAGAVLLTQLPGRSFSVKPLFPYVAPWYPPAFACSADCRLVAGVVGDGGLPRDASAAHVFGTMTISGLALPDVVLEPGSFGHGEGLDGGVAWSGAEEVTITATGDPNDVAGFGGALLGPTVIEPSEIPGRHARSSPLSLSWSTRGRSAAGEVRFVIEGSSTRPNPWNRARVECRFPVAQGQGVVSPAVLAELEPGYAIWSLESVTTTTATSADGLVHLGARSSHGNGSMNLE
ncbi:hypothetical protein L6R52_04370 [Myxococcota bacterium]|nr:hypothetical protein [Myxococcota bacterium]